MSSNNVELLSYTTNLSAGATYTSDKVILGQYISLNILPKADQSLTILLQFSGDGTHWDYSVSNSVSAGANDMITTPVQAKWMRVRITNNGVVATTFLRVFVYGTPSNSSIVAQIGKIGNFDPEVGVSNLPTTGFGSLKAEGEESYLSYVFNPYVTPGYTSNTAFVTQYPDIVGYSPNAVGSLTTLYNGLLSIINTTRQMGDPSIITSSKLRYHAGTSMIAKFSARFTQYAQRAVAGPGYSAELIGVGSTNGAGSIVDFLGWGNVDTVSTTLQFGIQYYRGGVLVATYLQSAWNIDKCDGTNQMPAINFNDYVNVFQIQAQYLGAGQILFSVENPNTGLPQPVHAIRYANANTMTNLSLPALGMIMYIRTDATGYSFPGDLDSVSVGSFSLGFEGKPEYTNEMYSISTSSFGVAAPLNVLTIRCDTTFFGSTNIIPVMLTIVSASSDGTKSVNMTLKRNMTLITPTWSTPYPTLSPVSIDTTGTLSASGYQVTTLLLAKSDQVFENMTSYRIVLNPGDTLTIVGQSAAASDVQVSMSWKNM